MIADHTAIVLLGRGGVAKSTTGELAELAAQLEAQLAAQWPGTQVQPAFVDRWYPCNHGPLMIVYPEGVWYGPLDAGGIRHVLTRHVLHGEVDAARHVHGPLRLPQKP